MDIRVYGAQMRFQAELYRWKSDAAWFFVTVPVEVAEPLSDSAAPGPRRGFGAVKVRVTVGGTTWTTSVFPQKDGTYVLPVKKGVRQAEGLDDGDEVTVDLEPIVSTS